MTNNNTQYKSVRGLVYRLTHKAQQRWGGDFDDWLGVAHLGVVMALKTRDPRKSKSLTTWVYPCVNNALKGEARRRLKRATRATILSIHPNHDEDSTHVPEVEKALHDHNQEARERLAHLIIDLRPTTVLVLWALLQAGTNASLSAAEHLYTNHNRQCPALAYGLVKHLLDQGWSREEVFSAFTELREVLLS